MKWLFSLAALVFLPVTRVGAAFAQAETPRTRVAYVTSERIQPEDVDKGVIFKDHFDRAPQGYFDYNPEGGSFVWKENAGYGGGGAMRCEFAAGQVEAGSLKVLFGKNPFGKGLRPAETFREIYWRVYVKHEAGWQGNPAKFARATCLASPNWSQGFIAHVWGVKGIRCVSILLRGSLTAIT